MRFRTNLSVQLFTSQYEHTPYCKFNSHWITNQHFMLHRKRVKNFKGFIQNSDVHDDLNLGHLSDAAVKFVRDCCHSSEPAFLVKRAEDSVVLKTRAGHATTFSSYYFDKLFSPEEQAFHLFFLDPVRNCVRNEEATVYLAGKI